MLQKLSYTSFVNNKDNGIQIIRNLNGLNPLDTIYPIGFAVHSDRLGDTAIDDGSFIDINNLNIGLIGGGDASDIPFDCGVKGSFYYQNSQLFGLDDDTPDSVMYASDGLADIKSYIPNHSTNFNLATTYQGPSNIGPFTNFFNSFHVTHSTPCDTFTVSLTEEIDICEGDTAFLNVSGGASVPLSKPTYEWEPQVGLSCYNCPNPIYTDTVSKWYTVRIWNTDSCSKVLPVKINVHKYPQDVAVQIVPTPCSDSVGRIIVTSPEENVSYALDSNPPQAVPSFNYLGGGDYTLVSTGTGGCSTTREFTVPMEFPIAAFTANPEQGDVPLEVAFTNQSTGATNYEWWFADDTLYTTNATQTYTEAGTFEVNLVAYDTYPQCADTATVTILAEYPLSVIAHSFHEQSAAFYTVQATGVVELKYSLYNAIGQQVYNTQLSNLSGGNEVIDLWRSSSLARGTYLYQIEVTGKNGEQKVLSGKVVVI